VRDHFERFNNARSLKSILKRMALFSGCRGMLISGALIRQTPVKQYERDQQLFTEDKEGPPFARKLCTFYWRVSSKVARRTYSRDGGSTKAAKRIIRPIARGGDLLRGVVSTCLVMGRP